MIGSCTWPLKNIGYPYGGKVVFNEVFKVDGVDVYVSVSRKKEHYEATVIGVTKPVNDFDNFLKLLKMAEKKSEVKEYFLKIHQ